MTSAARSALSARAATFVAARAWELSVDAALGSPPGVSRATVSGAVRCHCGRRREEGWTLVRRRSSFWRLRTRADVARKARPGSSAFCGTDHGESVRRARTQRREQTKARARTWSRLRGILRSLRQPSTPLARSGPCRVSLAKEWNARVLLERDFVSRRVVRFEAAQALKWARSGCPVTRVWCDGVV